MTFWHGKIYLYDVTQLWRSTRIGLWVYKRLFITVPNRQRQNTACWIVKYSGGHPSKYSWPLRSLLTGVAWLIRQSVNYSATPSNKSNCLIVFVLRMNTNLSIQSVYIILVIHTITLMFNDARDVLKNPLITASRP